MARAGKEKGKGAAGRSRSARGAKGDAAAGKVGSETASVSTAARRRTMVPRGGASGAVAKGRARSGDGAVARKDVANRTAHGSHCACCETELTPEYLGTLDSFTTLCLQHGKVHRAGFSHFSEEEFGEKYTESEEHRLIVDVSAKVLAGEVVSTAKPGEVAARQTVKMTAAAQHGGFSRSEFFKRYNVMPEQIGIRCWSLFDEWGEDYQGVLLDGALADAPRIHTISSERYREKSEFAMVPSLTMHDDQCDTLWGHEKSQYVEELKDIGCKVLTVADIDQRIKNRAVQKGDEAQDDDDARTSFSKRSRPVPKAVRPVRPQERGSSPDVPATRPTPRLATAGLAGPDAAAGASSATKVDGPSPAKSFRLLAKSTVSTGGGRKSMSTAETEGNAVSVAHVSEADFQTFLDKYPDDPDKAKWEFQRQVKLNPTLALGGMRMGRERNTANFYADEADGLKRQNEAAFLREAIDRNTFAEKLGVQKRWATMPRKELDAGLLDLKNFKTNFPTKAKEMCLSRAGDLVLLVVCFGLG